MDTYPSRFYYIVVMGPLSPGPMDYGRTPGPCVIDFVRLILVGEEFCGTSEVQCALLRDPLRAQSIQYFFNYHRARAEELR